jgi:hypothetical protein
MRPYVYLVLSCVLLLFCLLVDAASSTTRRQAVLGLCTLAFLIIASRFSPPEERRKVWVLVVLATFVELDCSILWGIYHYRLGNMPLYVPPAHGIIFLFGLRWARTPIALAHPRALQRLALAGAVIWAGAGLTLSPWLAHRPDVLGALCFPVLAWFITRPSGSIYSGVFLVTSLLELVGTGLGDWTWVATAPVVHIPVGSPPAAIAAGYCMMDYASSLIAGPLPAAEKGVRRLLRAQINTILRRAGNNKRRNPSLRISHEMATPFRE